MLGIGGKSEEWKDKLPERTVNKAPSGGDYLQEDEGMRNESILQ